MLKQSQRKLYITKTLSLKIMIDKILYEKLVFATESLKSKAFLLLLVLSLYTLNSRAQCDITAFTATPINGICVADGKLTITI